MGHTLTIIHDQNSRLQPVIVNVNMGNPYQSSVP